MSLCFLNLHYIKTEALSNFSCAYLPKVYLLGWSVYSIFLHFVLDCLLSFYWALRSLFIFWIHIFYQIGDLQMFPPSLWLTFSFSVSVIEQKIVISVMSVYQPILLWTMLLVLHLWNLCLTSGQKTFLWCSSRTFIIFRFKFRPDFILC